jgi:hypothetical protein
MGRDFVVGRVDFKSQCYCVISNQVLRKPDTFDALCSGQLGALVWGV